MLTIILCLNRRFYRSIFYIIVGTRYVLVGSWFDDFSASLATPGITNSFGSLITRVNVERIPGQNTIGVSLSRIDYDSGGFNPPHTHPRATEIVFVLYGELEVGFITTVNVLYTKIIKNSEIFVFPKGLVHFHRNKGVTPTVVIAAFNNQLPGTQSIATTLIGTSPPVPDDVLATAIELLLPRRCILVLALRLCGVTLFRQHGLPKQSRRSSWMLPFQFY